MAIICQRVFEKWLATAAGSVSRAITSTMPTTVTSRTTVSAVSSSSSR